MATTTENVDVSNEIKSRLSRLRLLIRTYVVAQGAAAVICCLAICFWVSLALDYLFEPPAAVRVVILALLGIVLLVVLFQKVFLRLLVPLTDRNMAMLLERRHQGLDDRLLTVVELSRRSAEQSGYDPRMLASTQNELERLIPAVKVGPVLRISPLAKMMFAAVILTATAVLFGAWNQSALQIWADRVLMIGEAEWPRATRIMVEGFPEVDGRRLVKVARGTDLTVIAKADTRFEIPNAIEVRYDEAVGRPSMTQLKRAVPGRDPFQFFEYQFKNIQSTVEFDVVAMHGGMLGKNDRVTDLVIEAVESPDLAEISLDCRYPEYLAMTPEKFSVMVIKPLPEGTQVTVEALASKDLVSAKYRRSLDDPDAPWEEVSLDEQQPRAVTLPLGSLATDTRVEFQLHDTDGVTNQQPIRLLLRIVPDEAPQVDVRFVGIGKSVTPAARLPIRGTIDDDHGVSEAYFEYSPNGLDLARRGFAVPSDGEFTEEFDIAFELADLQMAVGQKIVLGVKATDNYDLADEPHVGLGQRYELQIVSEGELRALLETKERLLRRRFESVIDEMQRSRDALTRLVGETQDSESSQQTVQILRTEEAVQTSNRMSHETRSIAEEFDAILMELDNNNVSFFAEFERRIGEGISQPLKDIADKMFPVLDDRLAQVRAGLEDDAVRPVAAGRARREVDAILREMERVLQNMLELREFNELLANLRKIIDAHKQVSQLTQEERERIKQKLRDELKKGLLD